jgi:hypothetical protein
VYRPAWHQSAHLQQFRKAIKAIVALAEHVHFRPRVARAHHNFFFLLASDWPFRNANLTRSAVFTVQCPSNQKLVFSQAAVMFINVNTYMSSVEN